MKGQYSFKGDIDGDEQMSSFQNATQTTLGDDARSIAVAVTPAFPDGFDLLDKDAVDAFMWERMQSLVEAGFQVEIQYGPFDSRSTGDDA
jgi:hypothetical protein